MPRQTQVTTEIDDEWEDYSDEQLLALEESLYDDEVKGSDCWFIRDRILNEMNKRGLCG
jgi:hypothetical protein